MAPVPYRAKYFDHVNNRWEVRHAMLNSTKLGGKEHIQVNSQFPSMNSMDGI